MSIYSQNVSFVWYSDLYAKCLIMEFFFITLRGFVSFRSPYNNTKIIIKTIHDRYLIVTWNSLPLYLSCTGYVLIMLLSAQQKVILKLES